MFWIIMIALIVAAAAAYYWRDKLAKLMPGMKHNIAGVFTTVSSFVLALAEYFKTINISTLVQDPATVTLIGMGLGLLILVLSWVTPRAEP